MKKIQKLKDMKKGNKILLSILIIIPTIILIYFSGRLIWFASVPPPEQPSPTLSVIVPNPDSDGNIDLSWSFDLSEYPTYAGEVTLSSYLIYRKVDSGSWVQLASSGKNTHYTDTNLPAGTYSYYILAYLLIIAPWGNSNGMSDPSNVESVIVEFQDIVPPVPPDDLPSNPSIIANGGASTTNSFRVNLVLSCQNADNMKFIVNGISTTWIPYTTTYSLTLNENDLNYPIYEIGVIFKNDAGESNEVTDTITYVESEEPEDNNGNTGATNYTATYILVCVLLLLFGVIGIFIYLKKKGNIKTKKGYR